MAGWGITEANKNVSPVLRYLTVEVKPKLLCKNETKEFYRDFVTFDKICAGLRNKSSSVCEGDSGGGLVAPYETKFHLLGVVSLIPRKEDSEGSCDSQQYGIFTNVANYTKSFLQENVADYRM